MLNILPIAISLSPNTDLKDTYVAFQTFCKPWLWKKGNSIQRVEKYLEDYLGVKNIVMFNSGRSALFALLKSFGIGKGDEVIVQAFTCVAVPNAIIWVGAKPVYVDIDYSLNIDPDKTVPLITKKTKAIIVQHTFGIPANIQRLAQIAKKHNLLLIEDCAHALGAEIKGKKVGTLADASFFSFGRDKVISSVFGGAAYVHSRYKKAYDYLVSYHSQLPQADIWWIAQQLFHPIAFFLILPLYRSYVGKLLLYVFQKLHFLSKPVYEEEYKGGSSNLFPRRYPNALASLLLPQLNKLDVLNNKRKNMALYYFTKLKGKDIKTPPNVKGAIYLRFNILSKMSKDILLRAKKKHILLGTWYRHIIDPKQVSYKAIYYSFGSCPVAEDISVLSVNLPTYQRLSHNELDQIINLL